MAAVDGVHYTHRLHVCEGLAGIQAVPIHQTTHSGKSMLLWHICLIRHYPSGLLNLTYRTLDRLLRKYMSKKTCKWTHYQRATLCVDSR